MKERHWISLIASIRHGQSVLILGPEIPVAFLTTTSADQENENLAEVLTAELTSELEDDGHQVAGKTLAAVAQQYEDAEGFGPNALRALTQRLYRSTHYTPSSVHARIASLPFGLILTTCQDDLLVRALVDHGKEPIVQRYHLRGDKRDNPEFILPNSPDNPLVYHVFGDANEPGSLVLSENDLLDFLVAIVSERPPLPNSLLRALKRGGQNLLFVGFGIKHWYLRVLLKVLVRSLELHRTSSSVATEPLRGLSESDRQQTILFYERGTRIEIEDAEIGAFLTELDRRIEAEGGVLERSAPLGPCPRVFISYAREDNSLAARVFDTLQKADFNPWLDKESLSGGDLWNDRISDELDAADFALVLYTSALCRKTDSYVNREIMIARQRSLQIRGPFLIPLRTEEIQDEHRIAELGEFHEMQLRLDHFDDDMAKVISSMRRDFQRRQR